MREQQQYESLHVPKLLLSARAVITSEYLDHSSAVSLL
jgi:hypothetical protein